MFKYGTILAWGPVDNTNISFIILQGDFTNTTLT